MCQERNGYSRHVAREKAAKRAIFASIFLITRRFAAAGSVLLSTIIENTKKAHVAATAKHNGIIGMKTEKTRIDSV